MNRADFPLRLGRGMNSREQYMQRAMRVSREKRMAWAFLRSVSMPPQIMAPITCRLTRIAPSRGLDSDNLQGSLKAVRDAFAAWVKVDDAREDLVRYVYAQERGPWGCRIEWAPSSEFEAGA